MAKINMNEIIMTKLTMAKLEMDHLTMSKYFTKLTTNKVNIKLTNE
jgi:hypothetical protein